MKKLTDSIIGTVSNVYYIDSQSIKATNIEIPCGYRDNERYRDYLLNLLGSFAF